LILRRILLQITFSDIGGACEGEIWIELTSLAPWLNEARCHNRTSTSSPSSSFKLDCLDLALDNDGIGAKVGTSFSGFGIPITARLGHLSLVLISYNDTF
jgi:hypothetical protein